MKYLLIIASILMVGACSPNMKPQPQKPIKSVYIEQASSQYQYGY
ncbi:hypothetical protein Psal159_03386 (plasmid) [Piscirickettsia salmonis]|nr:pyrrolo-quinoline quinone [Piscirickettsia salmonis]QGO82338.1 hypothetical protein Psal107_03389 [Piscirickettsia salmonis]QGP24167.1 hypothetical protein Psal158_03341 [Piscirickettsia salmonis]QGP27593.1 hypothetical protein Psal159_03386 [Piscirickettsia salmonis]QGP30939.1 hypothetical protein Psal160_03349 [Piscirickettsia salmonis]